MQVRLLNGDKYDQKELIDNMSSDEFYYSFLGYR